MGGRRDVQVGSSIASRRYWALDLAVICPHLCVAFRQPGQIDPVPLFNSSVALRQGALRSTPRLKRVVIGDLGEIMFDRAVHWLMW